jgi:hypothetical protein
LIHCSYQSQQKFKKEPFQPHKKLNGYPPKVTASGNTKQRRLTVQIVENIMERAKNAVYWTRGLTLAQLKEKALKQFLEGLEGDSVIYDESGSQLKKKGDRFPEPKEDLKSGQPVK